MATRAGERGLCATIISGAGGNAGSVRNVLQRLGATTVLTDDPMEVRRAQRLIIPGVGAFDATIGVLRAKGLLEALDERFRAGVPVLGICLGMHLLANSSEEGTEPGLGWIPATVRRIDGPPTLPVPHLGWNTVRAVRPHPLFSDLDDDARFYFAHSYRVVCDVPSDVLAVTTYGADFPSAVERDHVLGVQFHPEKSHPYGLRLLDRFLHL